jgi:ABC-type glycerol-3-phosphate transport system permease component
VSQRAFRWLVAAFLLVLVAVPLYWILDTSFKTGRQILMSQAIYAPRPFTLENYVYLFTETRFAL